MLWRALCSPCRPTDGTGRLAAAWTSPRMRPRRTAVQAAPAPPPPPPGAASGASSGTASGAAGFLDNPAIAQREALRLFYSASTAEAQLVAAQQAVALCDLGTSLQLLCHMADLAQKGMLPGSQQEQAHLLRFIHASLAPAVPDMPPLQLATMLWSYGAVGLADDWTDALLQQVAAAELAAGPQHLASYNTRELSSLMFACGRLLRHPTSEVRGYGAALAEELLKRWKGLPYVKGSFSSTDFADLAAACAALYGNTERHWAAAAGSGGSGSGGGSGGEAEAQPPAGVAELLDELAVEVRRQLANRSSRSPWAPRDLVRFARAYAALGHRTPKTAQMLDSLSSFCVQRIRARHLNCLSRPADLTGLLEAFADLQHSSVAVPDLLAAVGDQVRRGAAAEQDAAEAAAAATAAAAADPAASSELSAQHQQQQQHASTPSEPFSLAHISSLLACHLRLGYAPPPLLLSCLAPTMRRQAAASSPADAAVLLQLLAAVPYSPGSSVVELLLGRVLDGEEAAAGAAGGGRQCSERTAAAVRAAEQLLGS